MALFDRLKRIWAPESGKKGNGGEASAYGRQINLAKDEKQKKIAALTPREHDLFLLLLEGFTLRESARQLSVKYSTANTHMTGIYKKLGVNSRAELIINYRDTGGRHE